jgi:hypothetical protein
MSQSRERDPMTRVGTRGNNLDQERDIYIYTVPYHRRVWLRKWEDPKGGSTNEGNLSTPSITTLPIHYPNDIKHAIIVETDTSNDMLYYRYLTSRKFGRQSLPENIRYPPSLPPPLPSHARCL